MKKYGLNKKDKLCSNTAIDKLFAHRSQNNNPCAGDSKKDTVVLSSFCYPVKIVWRINHERVTNSLLQFLISVPKKRLRHAVDRVKVRRRIREAYRLNRHIADGVVDTSVDMAFIYVANDVKDYHSIEHAVVKLLTTLCQDFQTCRTSSPCSDGGNTADEP